MSTEKKEKNNKKGKSHSIGGEEKVLKRLQIRFISINAFSMIIVLAVVFFGIYCITNSRIKAQNQKYLENRIQQELRHENEDFVPTMQDGTPPEPLDVGQPNPVEADQQGILDPAAIEQEDQAEQTSSGANPALTTTTAVETNQTIETNSAETQADPETTAEENGAQTSQEKKQPAKTENDGIRRQLGSAVLVLDEDGTLLRTLGDRNNSDSVLNETIATVANYHTEELQRITVDGEGYLVLVQPFEDDNDTAYMLAYQNISADRNTMSTLLRVCILLGLASFVLVLILSIYLASRAQEPLRESIKMQRRFVADAAHELRTPIAVIRTNTDVVLLHPEKTVQEQEKWLRYIKEDTNRMSDLVDEMLYLAASDAEQRKSVNRVFDFSELVENQVLAFEPLLYEAGIGMEIDIEPLLHLNADPESIKKLVSILLDNVRRHGLPNAPCRIVARAEGKKLHFSVSNAVENMNSEDYTHLFDRFYRGDSARSHKESGGYGLGLSIAQRLVEESNGKISIAEEDGHRIAFVIDWTLAKSGKQS